MISSVDIHVRALDRHVQWELDFERVGDHESAMEARLDALAIAGELGMTRDWTSSSSDGAEQPDNSQPEGEPR